MRKDYTPVQEGQSAEEEAVFVEAFWTQHWQAQGRGPAVESVARREEYLIIQPFLQNLPLGSRLLDGGCGTGEWTVFLSNEGFEVVGLDISRATITRLEKLFPEHTFVAGDIRSTGFPDEAFDGYFSWGAFEHFENGLGECVAEARRILKPGGWLFVSVPFQNWRHLLRDSGPLHRWDPTYEQGRGYTTQQRFYQWRLTGAELQRELELRGFRVTRLQPFAKMEGLSRWMEWDLRWFPKGSLPARIATRILNFVVPHGLVGHMVLAAAQRRG